MKGRSRGFDRLARGYRAMEVLAFGRDLERARFEHLDRLRGCRDILLLGEGDGRCVERLATLAPAARIVCVDSSPGMIERARGRLAGTEASGRVSFICADALTYEPEPLRFDAVDTLFFLDCFGARDAARIVARVGAALKPGAVWLFADFVIPQKGLARARARFWIGFLYAFFRWETGLGVSALPPSEEILEREGWAPVASRDFQHGLIRSALLARSPHPTEVPAASA